MKILITVLLIVSFSTSCTTTYRTIPLPMPERPVYHKIRNQDLICLSDSSYEIVANHVVGMTMYIERLEAVIKSTWKK